MIFRAKFQRYANGQARLSGPVQINAGDIHEALGQASSILRGLEGADPEARYAITEIGSFDYRGTDCEGGIRMFETAEEMTERLSTKSKA